MKKTLTGLLALLASCTLFSACFTGTAGSSTSETSSPSSSVGTTSEETTSESTSEETPVDPHAEALELAKNFVYGDLVEKDLEVSKDYTLLASTYSFVLEEELSVSWTVDVTEGVVLSYDETNKVWKVDVDEFLTEDLLYTLTGTIADSDGHSISFTLDRKVLKAAQVVPEKITEAPVEGEAYKLYMYQEQKKNDLYFKGEMSGFYLATNNASKGEGYEVAIDVFAEKVEGKDAYYLTFTNAEGKKQYIGITNPFNNGKFHVNAILRDTVDTTLDAGEVVKTFEYTWNSELKTLVATLEGVKSGSDQATTETKTDSYFLGTSGSYYTFGAMSVSEAKGAYVGYLVKMVNKDEVSAEDKVASEKETLNITTAFSGAVEYTLPTQGTTYGDVAIAWAVKSGDATLTDNVLNVANPTADTTIVLTATITCGEATTTLDVEIVVHPKSPVTAVTEPKAGEAYAMYMYQQQQAKNYYFTGVMSGNYLGTTADAAQAADVYIEDATNGFKIYVMDASGAKSYITLTEYKPEDKNYYNASVSLTATGSVFTFNTQYGALCCKLENDTFFLTTYGDKTTMGASGSYYMDPSRIGEQYVVTFGIIDESALPPEGGDAPIVPGVTTSTVASVLAAENGEYQVEGTVMAVTAKSFVLKDSTGSILVYLNTAPSVKAGDKVTVKGTTSVYGKGKQFGAGSEVTFVSEGTVGMQIATSLTAADVDAYAAVETVTIKYVEVTATLSINASKGYYNLTVDGATAMASISYPTDAMKAVLAELDGKEISVEGYFIGVTGSSTKYVQIMAVNVKATDAGIGDEKPGEGEEECKHEYDKEGVCVNCGEKDPDFKPEVEEPEVPENAQTATLSIADYAAANGWSNGTLYSQITLADGIVATANGTNEKYGVSTGKYYTDGNTWRIYQSENATLVITADEGITIFSVMISYLKQNTGILTFNGANVDTDEIVYVNAASATFGVANTGTATNGQARITAIEVVYVAGEVVNPGEGEDEECKHEYDKEGVCVNCGAADPDYKPEEEHTCVDENGDFVCDACEEVVLPEADSVLTVAQAKALADALGAGNYTTNKYYMTVVVENIYNTQYGNANVKDANGNKYVIYGLYSADGATRYDALAEDAKPVAGDEITVYGVIGSYAKDGVLQSYQMKNGWIDELVAHTHAYEAVVTAPTCTAEGFTTHTCSICQDVYKDNETPALGHTTEEGVCDNCGNTIGGDAVVAEYVKVTSADEFTTGTYVLIVNDKNVTVSTFDGSWIKGSALNASSTIDKTTGDSLAITLEVSDAGVKIKIGTQYVKPKSGNNNGIQAGSYDWAYEFQADGTIVFKGTGSDTTTLAYNVGSSGFRAYKTSTVSGNPSGYPNKFTAYKLVEGSAPESDQR